MRNLNVFLATLFLSYGTLLHAAPASRSDDLVNDYSNSSQTERSTRAPASMFRQPGILPCPDQSRETQMRDLARLENHSRDCRPTTGGAIKTQPDRPDGEVRDSDLPTQFQ